MYKIITNKCGKPMRLYQKILLIMRLTTVILMVSLLQVSASSLAQRLTFSRKDASLQQVFQEIGRRSGYNLVYDSRILPKKLKIDISVREATVEEALKSAIRDLPLSFQINDKAILIKTKEEPSLLETVVARFLAIDVRGRILDEKGNGLPGVTVKVKGSGKVVLSDKNGNYFIKNVEEGETLLFSYIGYKPLSAAVVAEMGDLQLELSDSKLDEVQVVAYGETTQRLNVGNVTTIKASEIEKQNVNNPLLALQGRVPGLLVTSTSGLAGSAVKVQLRGQNTLFDTTEPLYVVDGLPIPNNIPGLGNGAIDRISAISFINPSDIESIEVLKDANATSIYGSRGANGVILITTKKGKAGSTLVDLSVKSGYSDVPQRMELMNTGQYLEMRKEAFDNANVDFVTKFPYDNPDYQYALAPDLTLWDRSRYTDWQEELLGKSGIFQDVLGSISGGSESVQFNIGGTYHRETTVFSRKNADQRGSARVSLTGTTSDQKLRAVVSASYLNNKNTLPGADLTRFALTLAPNAPAVYNSDGTINWELSPLGTRTWTNPYAQFARSYESHISNLIASGDISYAILPSLKFKTQVGYNELRGSAHRKTSPFAGRTPEDNSPYATASFNTNGTKSLSVEPQLQFSASLLKGKVDLLIGASAQSTIINDQVIDAEGFTTDAQLDNLQAAQTYTIRNNSSEYRYSAAFGRLNYNLKDKYLLEGSVRRDGSSRFGPGKQFGNFASIGTAWIFSEEKFVKTKFPFLSYGKLRSSYGSSGNDKISDYAYLDRYYFSPDEPYLNTKGLISKGIFNENYRWESTRKLEIGLELGFLQDRLLATGSFFQNRSDNQLVAYPYPSMVGDGFAPVNSPALIQNTGFELTISSRNLRNSPIIWNTNINLTVDRNKLIAFPDMDQTGYQYDFEIGQPFAGVDRAYKFAGVNSETGFYQFRTTSGQVVANPFDGDRFDYGKIERISRLPKFYGGISNTVRYKGWSLDFFFQIVKQTGFSHLREYAYNGYLTENAPVEFSKRWRALGDDVELQKVFGLYSDELTNAKSFWVESDAAYADASFIRLKNLSLSYTLQESWNRRLKAQNLRFSLQGQNLWTITPYKGLDPEMQSISYLPTLRVVTLGLHITL